MNRLLPTWAEITLIVFFPLTSGWTQKPLGDLVDEVRKTNQLKSISKTAKKIRESDYTSADVYKEIISGDRCPKKPRTGFIRLKQEGMGLPPYAALFVPTNYDCRKKYPVEVMLHGATTNTDPDYLFNRFIDTVHIANYIQNEKIYLFPSSWWLTPWWSQEQVTNISALLRWVKLVYNIDESKIRLGGFSDGATGTYYVVNSMPTGWSSITPFFGSISILNFFGNRHVYFLNYSAIPALIINGRKDEVFPIEEQVPFFNQLVMTNGKDRFITIDSAKHNLNWLPPMRNTINQFIDNCTRAQIPDTLIWQTEQINSNRNNWVIINSIGNKKVNQAVDVNSVLIDNNKVPAFRRDKPFAYVKAIKKENRYDVSASNTNSITLLVQYDRINYQLPVEVWINEKQVFSSMLQPDLFTMLKWYNTDLDRLSLYANELKLKVE